jgi:hypothetical protein
VTRASTSRQIRQRADEVWGYRNSRRAPDVRHDRLLDVGNERSDAAIPEADVVTAAQTRAVATVPAVQAEV